MADGFDKKQTSLNTGFIAYQDEEHGLGFKVAQKVGLTSGGGRPTRRLTTADTMTALITQKATKAVLPLENDRGGYDTSVLSTLLDFKDYVVKGEHSDTDNYCLAAPSVSIHEIAQSAFPGTFSEKGAVGPFPKDRQAQNAYRKRIEVVYASADAFERCEATIDELRANGVDVRRLPDETDPYREVLNLARKDLDPNRKIRTQLSDNKHTMISDAAASNFTKPLIGVLLPQDVAVGVESKFNPVTGRAHGAEFDGDFVILDPHLADHGADIRTRFLEIERKPAPKKAGDKPAKHLTPREQVIKKLESTTSRYARILLKVDTRGEKTGNLSEITDPLVAAGIQFRPIYLHDRPETLPVVLEIEIDTQLGLTSTAKKAIGAAWDKAFNKTRNHDPVLIAAYGSTETAFAGIIMPTRKKSKLPLFLGLGLLALILIAAAFAAINML